MIEGLSHLTFVASNLDRTTTFLREVLDAEEVYSSGSKTFSVSREKFFLLGGVWVAVMEGDPLKEKTYDHVAFEVQEGELEAYAERVRAHGPEIREGRSRVQGEGDSLYFYDHDNHLFELHTGTLDRRLRRYEDG